MLPTKTDSRAMLPKCALNVAMLPGDWQKCGVRTEGLKTLTHETTTTTQYVANLQACNIILRKFPDASKASRASFRKHFCNGLPALRCEPFAQITEWMIELVKSGKPVVEKKK